MPEMMLNGKPVDLEQLRRDEEARDAAAVFKVTTLDEARYYIWRFCDNYSRLQAVLDLGISSFKNDNLRRRLGIPLDYDDSLTLLGEAWTSCDNIRHYQRDLRDRLGTRGPLRQMMSPEENEAYDALPDSVRCYRGCDRSVLTGACWTLDKVVANMFPFLQRYRAPSPVVVTARVRKNNILALKLDRGESEIVTFSARRLKVEPADEALSNAYHAKKREAQMAKLHQSKAR
jgi:hypothetical protein